MSNNLGNVANILKFGVIAGMGVGAIILVKKIAKPLQGVGNLVGGGIGLVSDIAKTGIGVVKNVGKISTNIVSTKNVKNVLSPQPLPIKKNYTAAQKSTAMGINVVKKAISNPISKITSLFKKPVVKKPVVTPLKKITTLFKKPVVKPKYVPPPVRTVNSIYSSRPRWTY